MLRRFALSLFISLIMVAPAFGANYYVSVNGSDANNGLTPATAWKTLAKLNGSTLLAGDAILLERGDTRNEPLIPPSSGSNGSPITFDAYGTGPAPKITGYFDLGNSWTNMGGNVWKATLSGAGAVNTVLFNTMFGQKQTTQANVLVDRDWYFSGSGIYVHATTNPVTYYGGPVAVILMANTSPVLINGRTWLSFQHLDISWFDGSSTAGVNVGGASDHLVFANMIVASQVASGTTPHGFFVNASAPATDIKFYNVDAHLNYDGFRFYGSAASGAFTLVNCAAFGNRDGAVVDLTSSGATYSYSHFYGNNITTIYSQDVQGSATAGSGNVGNPAGTASTYVDPQVTQFAPYVARDTFTVDDVGLSPGTEDYINSQVLPAFTSRGMQFGAAVTAGYPIDLASVQNWFNLGHDINSHSWSHQYWSQPNAINLQYVGAGTAATVTISGTTLTTSVTGGPGGQNLSLDLTNGSYAEIADLLSYLSAHYAGVYAATVWKPVPDDGRIVRTTAHSVGLAQIAGLDIKTATVLQFDKQRMITDELSASKAWLNANVSGLNEKTYVYPDGIEDGATEGYAEAAGYTGARGTLSMTGAFGATYGANEVASRGVDAQNIVSLSIAWHGQSQASDDAEIGALTFKQKLWGYPVGLFVHNTDLVTGAEIGYMLDSLKQHGVIFQKNSEMVAAVATGYAVPATTPVGVYFQSAQTGPGLNAARLATSPDVRAGQNLSAVLGSETFSYDLNGYHRTGAWDVGAYQMQGSKMQGARLNGAAKFY